MLSVPTQSGSLIHFGLWKNVYRYNKKNLVVESFYLAEMCIYRTWSTIEVHCLRQLLYTHSIMPSTSLGLCYKSSGSLIVLLWWLQICSALPWCFSCSSCLYQLHFQFPGQHCVSDCGNKTRRWLGVWYPWQPHIISMWNPLHIISMWNLSHIISMWNPSHTISMWNLSHIISMWKSTQLSCRCLLH